jgi:uncharacterized protein YggE
MSSATVTVQGRAVVAGEPDEADIRLSLSSVRNTRDEALSEVAQQSDELERILDELDIPESARRTSGLRVAAETEYDGTTKKTVHRGYRASNVMTLRLAEHATIGALLRQASRRLLPDISGPYWRLALDNPAYTEACTQAALDAKRKADAYASALGVRLGPVQRVSDPEVNYGMRGGFEYHDHLKLMSDASPDPSIEVHRGELDVASVVEVTFSLEQPG